MPLGPGDGRQDFHEGPDPVDLPGGLRPGGGAILLAIVSLIRNALAKV